MKEYHKIQSVFKRDEVTKRFIEGEWSTAKAEGLVLRPSVQLFNRKGERIITKVKTKDFIQKARQ